MAMALLMTMAMVTHMRRKGKKMMTTRPRMRVRMMMGVNTMMILMMKMMTTMDVMVTIRMVMAMVTLTSVLPSRQLSLQSYLAGEIASPQGSDDEV